jgi:phosphatidylglycerophosphate synthase
VNLPNTLTVARICATPLIAWLPFAPDWRLRLLAFVLFIAAAVTDYWDGHLARTRGLITDLGKQLDPLADKLLLLGTFVPMYLLQAPEGSPLHHYGPAREGVPVPGAVGFPFLVGSIEVYLPLVVILVILGREAAMTAFRSAAARKGVVIAAIGSAKLKTVLQQVWVGTAYFWFFAATAAHVFGWWGQPLWTAFTWLNGVVGALSMTGATVLTLWSLVLYVRRYGGVLVGRTGT